MQGSMEGQDILKLVLLNQWKRRSIKKQGEKRSAENPSKGAVLSVERNVWRYWYLQSKRT